MKYYWINIDKSIDRRVFMEEQFKKLNLDNIRINAIIPDDLSSVLNEITPYICGNPECSYIDNKNCKFEFCCLCSHIKAIQEALKSNDDYFIIMEDDICIPFKLDFNKLINDLPNDFEIFQMMILYEPSTNSLYNNLYLSNINYIKYRPIIPSTGMYLISRKGAEKLINLYYKNNKYDFKSFNSIKVADILLYLSVITYTTTFPFCYPNINLISEIHPDHFKVHNEASDAIINILKNNKKTNNYILDVSL